MAFLLLAVALVGSLCSNTVFGQLGQSGRRPGAGRPAAGGATSAIDPKLGLVAQGERCPDGRPCGRNPVTGDLAGFEEALLGGGGGIPGGGFGGVGGSHGGQPGFGGSGGSYKHCPGNTQCCCLPPAVCRGDESAGGFPDLDLRIVNRPPPGIVCQAGDIYCCSGDVGGGGGIGGGIGGGGGGGGLYPPGTCGVQLNNFYKSPYGQADYGEYPWQAIILDQQDNFVGGGVLLDNRNVLTATHRVLNFLNQPYGLKVRLGDWDVAGENPEEKFPYQEAPVAQLIAQDGFDKRFVHNNLAILKLAKPIKYTPVITPICLPDYNIKSFDNQYCWTAGWGKDAFGYHGQYQAILKEVDVKVLPPQTCQELLGRALSTPQHRYRFNRVQHICAGGEPGKDACEGDGGSGLVCQNQYDKKFYLAGIVAFGKGCADPDVPGGYMNVLSNVDWIRKHIGYGGGGGVGK